MPSRKVRSFPTFDDVIKGVEELIKRGWRVRLVLGYNFTHEEAIRLCPPDSTETATGENVLDAIYKGFIGEGFPVMMTDMVAALGMPLSLGRWVYAVGEKAPSYLDLIGYPYTQEHLNQCRRRLMTACGLQSV